MKLPMTKPFVFCPKCYSYDCGHSPDCIEYNGMYLLKYSGESMACSFEYLFCPKCGVDNLVDDSVQLSELEVITYNVQSLLDEGPLVQPSRVMLYNDIVV